MGARPGSHDVRNITEEMLEAEAVDSGSIPTYHFKSTLAKEQRNDEDIGTVEKVFNDFVLKFGMPSRLHHDQGREFENRFFFEMQKMYGVKGSRTTPYHPQGNGQVERFNRTLLQMLRTLEPSWKLDWKSQLNKVVNAYNCTKNETTGYSPFFLMFGRHPTLPIDLVFPELQQPTRKQTYSQYVAQWRDCMEDVYKLASEQAG